MPFQDQYVGSTSAKAAAARNASVASKVSPGSGTYPVVTNPTLTFGGDPQVPVTNTNLTWGSAGYSTNGGFSTYDTSPGIFTTLFGTLTGGSSTPAASGPAGGPAPTITTGQVDGSTGFISGLQDQLGGILGAIGSTGDAPAGQVYAASYGDARGGGLDWTMILAVLAIGGVIYAVAGSK